MTLVGKNKGRKARLVILMVISFSLTAWGLWLLLRGQTTNGLLAMILGELIDLPKREYSEELSEDFDR